MPASDSFSRPFQQDYPMFAWGQTAGFPGRDRSAPHRPPSWTSMVGAVKSTTDAIDAVDSKASPPGYSMSVEELREREYPHMKQGIYLDHGGATIYAQSLVRGFSESMMANLYGNPHSENEPARLSGQMVDDVREKALRFLGADPEHFDLVFVANATAAVKLVADSFRDLAEKTRTGTFWYGYHKDCHTSLVGVREYTNGDFEPFETDDKVERWLDDPLAQRIRRVNPGGLGLFAYPGQSNMSGRRLPRDWLGRLRKSRALQNTYSLFDAAALAMTSSLAGVFADPDAAPDFTCLSFYKIFGFPDVGALVVRRESGHILNLRKYFGGGTVMFVTAIGRSLSHLTKGLGDRFTMYNIHDGLEDGTLPFHSILALGVAIDVHARLYGSMDAVSKHAQGLARRLYRSMAALRHANGVPVCHIVEGDHAADVGGGWMAFGDAARQGPTVAFNVMRADGSFVEWTEVERLANEVNIYIRAGGVCCPGGLHTALGYEQWEWERMRSAGHACGATVAVVHQLPTGIVRASLGAMSTERDVDELVQFLRDTFITPVESSTTTSSSSSVRDFAVAAAREEAPHSSCNGASQVSDHIGVARHEVVGVAREVELLPVRVQPPVRAEPPPPLRIEPPRRIVAKAPAAVGVTVSEVDPYGDEVELDVETPFRSPARDSGIMIDGLRAL